MQMLRVTYLKLGRTQMKPAPRTPFLAIVAACAMMSLISADARADAVFASTYSGTNDTNGVTTIQEYSSDGTTINSSVISGIQDVCYGITEYNGKIFIADAPTGTISEYTTSGALINASLISGLNYPVGMVVSGANLYVANAGSGVIGEYSLSGAAINASLITGLNGPWDLATSGGDIYVANSGAGSVGVYSTSGAVVNASLITGINRPTQVAVSGGNVFVSDFFGGRIQEYSASGTHIKDYLTNKSYPEGIVATGNSLLVPYGYASGGTGVWNIGAGANAGQINTIFAQGSNAVLGITVASDVEVPANLAGPDDPAYFTGTRPDPGSSGPPNTYSYQSLDITSGSGYTLGSNETLNLNNGAGTLTVQPGAVFVSNGLVEGNILNEGLVIVPITRAGMINDTHGGVIQINPPAPPGPGQPVVIPSPNPITVNPGTSLVIGSGGFGGDGTVGGGSGGGTAGNYTWTTPSVGNSGTVSWDGKLEVTGDYTQTSTGALRLFVAGHDQGTTYSLLQVDQHISLSGTLQVVLEPDLFHFLPVAGQMFDMIVGQQGISLDGSLSLQTLVTSAGAAELLSEYGVSIAPYLSPYAADPNSLYVVSPGLFTYGLVDGGTTLELTFTGVPEPSTAVLCIMGVVAIAGITRRNRRRGRLSH
jgi:hypothetical protein